MANTVPDAVARFLAVTVENVAQLELLLRLRADPERWWTADAVARELAAKPLVAQRDLEHLHSRGLAERGGDSGLGYRYAPGPLAPVLDQVADVYERRRTTVVNLIFSESRDDAVSLAEAFRLRRN